MDFDPRPLYEEDQVITENDIAGIINGFVVQYNSTSWWRIFERQSLAGAVGAMYGILDWMQKGKPMGHYERVAK